MYTRPATHTDLASLAPRLRYEDVREIKAASGLGPEAGLSQGLFGSDFCDVICEGPEVLGVYGVGPTGIIWMVGTEALVTTHRLEFLRKSRDIVDAMNGLYRIVYNAVDSRNTIHVRWLQWLGCTFTTTIKGHDPNVDFLLFFRGS